MNSFLRKSFVLVMAVLLVLPMAFSFAAVEVRAEDPTSTKLTITASKSLEGRALKAGEFTFELTGTGIDAPMTATNDANGKIEFDEITYTSTGTYTYTIKEVVPADAENADGVKYSEANDDQKKVGGFAKDGITYDSSEKVMVVTVDAGINITSVTLDGEKQDVKPSGTTGTSTGSLGDSVTVNAVLGEDIDGDGEPDYPQAYSYYQEGDTLVALRDGDTVFYCIDDDLLTPDVEGTYYSSTFEPADATDLNDAATIKTIKKLLYFGAPHDGGTNETPDWIIEEAKSLVNSYTYDLESAQNAFEFITSRLLHGVTNARQGHDTANTQTDILDVIIDRETGDYIGGAAERAESGSLTMFDLLSQRIWKKVVDSSTDYVADLVTLHFYTTDGPNRGEDIDSRQRIVTAEISQSASASVDLDDAFENEYKETVTVSGSKTWEHGDNPVDKQPTSITIKVMNGTEVAGTKTVTAEDDWKWTFENLPKYKDGKEIKYTIEEEEVENYAATVTDFNVKNTYTVETTSITVTKKWVDDNNKAGKRPESVTVSLRADGGNTGKSVVLNEANNWTATFENLPLKEDGQAISYNIIEVSVDEYEGTVEKKSDNEFVLTNTYKPEEEEKKETTEIKIIKHWDDMGNFEKKRPDSIAITLYADDEEVETRVITDAEQDENGNWLSTFENLPKTNAAGKTIKYTVEEKAIDYYVTSIYNTSEGVFEVFNTSRPWIPRVPGTPGGYGKVIVKKTVSGAAETDKIFEFVAKVTYQTGDVTETKFKLTAAGDPYTMDMIPEGAVVEITEETPAGYTAKYTIGADECNTVTVEKNSETTITVNNDKPAAPDKPESTKPAANTGDDSNMMLWLAICAAAGLTALTSKKLRRR